MKASDLIPKKVTDTDLIICEEPSDYDAARDLIQEYANSLNIDLEFQNYENEINNLVNHYGRPTGMIILAKRENEYAGCICFRNLGDFKAEIKRMYVRPGYRGKGLGRKLLNKALEEAKGLGYRFIRLDTIPEMESAIQLYNSTGFYIIEDFGTNPLEGARFMEYKL